MELKVDGGYNWKYQKDRLKYLGKKGLWHQFAKINNPYEVWCEVLEEDLHMLEETKNNQQVENNNAKI
jgi:hypothetical protein